MDRITSGTGGRGPVAALVSRCGLAALSGALLAAPCLETDLFPLGWIGLVPLLFAIEGRSPLQSYFLGVVAGVVFWAALFYWLTGFVARIKGYPPPYPQLIALLLYLYGAQLFGVIAWLLQWLRRHARLPDPLLVPVVFLAVFAAFPMLFYLRLGEGQTGFPIALQGADITGAHGLDFMMAMTSALVYGRLRRGWRARPQRAELAGVALLLAWFGYGALTLSYWERQTASWPTKRIGIVQPNDQVSLDIPPPPPGYTRRYPPEMEMTERLAARGAELVVWPEARYKGYFDYSSVRREYAARVAAAGTYLLFHDLERSSSAHTAYNSAVLLTDRGELAGTYRKVKRVAFGEYLPVVAEIGVMRRWLESYLGDFLREIAPGSGHGTFVAAGMRVVPKVCYETAFPEFLAEAIGADGAGKVLVVLSQDGWFGETRQPFQHLWASALRAVENRVPLVHAINNGPSGVILPSGRIAQRGPAFERAELLFDLPYSPHAGGSFYSRFPGAFLSVIYLLFAMALAMAAIGAWRRTPAGEEAPTADVRKPLPEGTDRCA